jgi:hypothetical protein
MQMNMIRAFGALENAKTLQVLYTTRPLPLVAKTGL